MKEEESALENLIQWRTRHHAFKIELLKLSNKIVESNEPDDIFFYQKLCEYYAHHLKKIETECYEEIGVNICTCNFNPEQCNK